MQRKLISNAALSAAIAHAITTREAVQADSMSLANDMAFEFVQISQDRNKRHTCSTAHDMLKDEDN